MKTIYKCDVCGKMYVDNWEQCIEHEKACEETHATGIRLTRELNSAIATAKEHGGIQIAITCDHEKAYSLASIYYDAAAKAVVLDIGDDGYTTLYKEDANNE